MGALELPSNTSNAIGTAQQYLPQEPKVYQKNLVGVPLQWNVTTKKDGSMGEIAGGLQNLGLAIDKEDVSRQKRQMQVAEAVSPRAYARLTDDERMKMNAREMLISAGNYDLIDNEYALAKIDELKGNEVNERATLAYQDKMANEEIKPTGAEQIKDYEDFFKDFLEKSQVEESLNNTFAFDNAVHAGKVKSTMDVYSRWLSNKNEVARVEKINSITSKIAEVSRGLLTKPEEEAKKDLDDLCYTLRILQDGHAEENAKLAYTAIEHIAKSGCNPELLDYFKGLEWTPDPRTPNEKRTIGQVFPIADYKDVANETNKALRTARYTDIANKLEKLTTVEGLEDEYKKLFKEDPEGYRMTIGNYDRYKNEIIRQQERREAIALMKAKQNLSKIKTAGALNSIVQALINGKQATVEGIKIPSNEADLNALGWDKATYLQGMQDYVSNAMMAGNYQGLEKIMNNNFIGKDLRDWLSNNLDFDLRNTSNGLSDSVKHALNMDSVYPQYTDVMFNSEQAGRIKGLNILMNNFGEEAGLNLYTEAEQRLNNSDEAQAIISQLSQAGLAGNSSIENTNGIGETNIYITPENNPSIFHAISTASKYLLASGHCKGAEEAIKLAKENILGNYVGYKNTVIPKMYLDRIFDDRRYSGTAFRTVLRKYEIEIGGGSPVIISYDNEHGENAFVFKVAGTTQSERISAEALTEEAYGWLKDNYSSVEAEVNGENIHSIYDYITANFR